MPVAVLARPDLGCVICVGSVGVLGGGSGQHVEESDDLQAQRLASGVMAKLEILEGRPGERRAALRGRSQRG